jgi:protein TonB
MVPPEEIDVNAPTTLPADFGEWDSGEAAAQAAAAPVPEVVPVSSPAPKPPAKPAAARVAVLPAAGRAPSAPPRPPAPAYTEVEPAYQAPQPKRAKAEEPKPRAESAEPEKKSGAGKFAVIGVVALVLIGGGSVAYMKGRPKAVPTNQPVPAQTAAMTAAQRQAAAQGPATQANGGTPEANTPVNNTPAADTPQPNQALSAQGAAMAQSANAASRIQKDLSMVRGTDAPPTSDFGAGAAEGPVNNPFSGQNGPKVKVAQQKVAVSSGPSAPLVIQRARLVYPQIARLSHGDAISGTVVVQATISKTGAVGNLRAISGPPLLRQAALDSVKNWRFKPSMLDGQPVEADTTVNVTFAAPQ